MRKIVIGAAAAATLIAAWFAPDQDGGVVGPAAATTREADPVPATPAPQVAAPAAPIAMVAPPANADGIDLQIHPRVADDEMGNVFAKQSWAPEAPKKVMQEQAPQVAQQASAPSGPPALPFQFLGRFTDEGKTAYFLQIDGQNVVARPGEKVNDSYLLDSVSGNTMNFVYLPLNQKQTLVVGDTN
ncbi:hypothetical protein [Rugamonas aquatica]|uniref:Secretion system X translation initiation factor n=1 Tax=Rugamonas aquatica TaxID=2743357 RepID=A0A6A7N6G7_9BURK|nr:hypothetical protein [Rugamonas aquatica]MQA40511.1 hypothetical protein [Rugamonas aquatica]